VDGFPVHAFNQRGQATSVFNQRGQATCVPNTHDPAARPQRRGGARSSGFWLPPVSGVPSPVAPGLAWRLRVSW